MKKAIVIFCEGPHDVAFIQSVFKFKFELKPNDKVRISEIKKPFGPFLSKGLEKHFMDDLSLEMAHKFYLPNLVYETANNYILVFNSGGETKVAEIKYLIANFENTYRLIPEEKDFESISYIFTFDCDYKKPVDKIETCKNLLKSVTKRDLRDVFFKDDTTEIWSFENLISYKDLSYAYIGDKVGFFVWSNFGNPGTLEDIYFPLMSQCNQSLIQDTEQFVNGCFASEMQPIHPEKPDEVSSKRAKRLKTIMSCAGQGKNTGAALASIYKLNTLINESIFSENSMVKEFSDFLSHFMK